MAFKSTLAQIKANRYVWIYQSKKEMKAIISGRFRTYLLALDAYWKYADTADDYGGYCWT